MALESGKWQEAFELSDRVLELSHDGSDLRTAYFVDAAANLRLSKLDRAEKSARRFRSTDRAAIQNPA